MDPIKLEGALERFETASKPTVPSTLAVNATATGLIFLTGLIADLCTEVETLRAEVRVLREHLPASAEG
jgi:hypothetical protein